MHLRWFFIGVLSFTSVGFSLVTTRPKPVSVEDRLARFPTRLLPLEKPLTIRWSANMIPFIEAQTDGDLAFALGLVQAHLRSGQLEWLRHASQGRLAELAGPLAIDIDKTLRIVDLGKAAQATIAAMDPASRAYVERFLAGLNFYLAHNREHIPVDLRAAGKDEIPPWTLTELVTAWKLASADVNWFLLLGYLMNAEQPGAPKLWQDLLRNAESSTTSFQSSTHRWLFDVLFASARTGSNSIAVGKSKSSTGAALIASDPHLGISIPSLWMVVAYQSPSYHCVGLMIPSLPFVAVGRNARVAWGGTNMWGISTSLFALSTADLARSTTRRERIKVRGWFDTSIEVRDSPLGPVLSDSPLLKNSRPFAFRWMGHQVSDEITAFLRANRSRNVDEFRRSFATYAVSAQNMLVADTAGDIGHVLAYRQPLRPDDSIRQPIQPATNDWIGSRGPLELPFVKNPPSGFIASANNKATDTRPAIGWVFQSSDRVNRLGELAGGKNKLSVDDLRGLQQDTLSRSALAIRDLLGSRIGALAPAARQTELWRALSAWDGRYRSDSRGALAHELLMAELVPRTFRDRYDDLQTAERAAGFSGWKTIFIEQLGATPDDQFRRHLLAALTAADARLAKFEAWGDVNAVRLAHPLGRVPWIGKRYRLLDFPTSGGPDTLHKVGRGLGSEPTFASYGANARHISDLGSLDENYFVLLGGQDGWLTSPQTIDQAAIWRQGEYLRLPLSADQREGTFPRRMTLTN